MMIVEDPANGFDCPRNYSDPSRCRIMLTTPRLVEAGRWWFGCDDLEGVEVENQPTSNCLFVGSHWEQRLFASDVSSYHLTPLSRD